MKTCYRCASKATTDEHVPPKCLFPAAKDTGEKDYRKNLITVPSCEEHNLKKSKDDEFLMATLTMVVGNNSVAYQQAKTKIARAMQHTNYGLLKNVMTESESLFAVNEEGVAMPVLYGRADMPRLRDVLESVALGLYYKEKEARFLGRCAIFPTFVTYDPKTDESGNSTEFLKWIARLLVERESISWPKKGTNPEIFYYQFGPPDECQLTPLRMCFFEGTEVMASFIPEGATPPLLGRKCCT